MKTYWVYILRCDNNSFYTGYTTDLVKRYKAHSKGTGSKYTRSFKPVSIAQCWEITGEKSLAMTVERQIKKMSREDKERLILSPEKLCCDLTVKAGLVPSCV